MIVKDRNWYAKGEEAARKARAKAESRFRPELWLVDGDEAEIIFLDKESFSVYQHSTQIRKRTKKYSCRSFGEGKGCPICKVDDPRYIEVYRVIDLRDFKNDSKIKNKAKKVSYKEKYYEVGARMQKVIARLMRKKLLYKKVSILSRDGKGSDTTYQLIPKGPISERLRERLGDMLTPKLDFEKDYIPKSVEEMRDIAKIFGDVSDDDDDDDDEDEKEGKRRNYLDDEDEDEEDTKKRTKKKDDEEEDDEEEDDEEEDDEEEDDEEEDDEGGR